MEAVPVPPPPGDPTRLQKTELIWQKLLSKQTVLVFPRGTGGPCPLCQGRKVERNSEARCSGPLWAFGKQNQRNRDQKLRIPEWEANEFSAVNPRKIKLYTRETKEITWNQKRSRVGPFH